MSNILLMPPLAFIIFLILSLGISRVTVLFAAKGKDSSGKLKAYACGENVDTNKVQPDYEQFFPFAFFFTIMHVVALIITTVPSGIPPMAVLYLVASIMAVLILFRR